jgi:hypothetical protein
MTMTITIGSLISDQDLAAAKAGHRTAVLAPAGAKIWRLFHFGTAAETVNFANIPPVQVAGEFGMTADPASGGFDGYYFF